MVIYRKQIEIISGLIFFILYFHFVLNAYAAPQEKKEFQELSEKVNLDVLNTLPALPGIGELSAPVQIKMFQDVTCGMCAYFFKNTFEEINKRYISTGKVRFEFIQFPIVHDTEHIGISAATMCADHQDKFMSYIKVLYGLENVSLKDSLKYAKLAKLNSEKFEKCLTSNDDVMKLIVKYIGTAEALAVDGTPTFFINGKKFVGSLNLQEFSGLIDEALIQKRT